jgi:hypothetical protein
MAVHIATRNIWCHKVVGVPPLPGERDFFSTLLGEAKKALRHGLPIQRSVELCLSAKYPDHIEGIKEIARLYFGKS